MWSVSCNLQTGSDFPQLVQTVKSGKNHSVFQALVTHTAVSSPKCNSKKRPCSNSVAFWTSFKWHLYCGILKIDIIRKINTGIRYEPVYRPALGSISSFVKSRASEENTEAAGFARGQNNNRLFHQTGKVEVPRLLKLNRNNPRKKRIYLYNI